jgi:hypothetical protein
MVEFLGHWWPPPWFLAPARMKMVGGLPSMAKLL